MSRVSTLGGRRRYPNPRRQDPSRPTYPATDLPPVRELIEATAELRAELIEREARYSELAVNFEQKSVFDVCAMKSEEDVAAALVFVGEIEQANQARIEFLAAFPDRLEQQVRATGSSQSEAFIQGSW